ncbi:histone-lysine N-methyltransferase SETMAR [Plakobranchus ocellatus]|uniref:Histone-lysine N-methyltransferase SETMAR n=1 Tax=Plakobranchus ocellatus TaxID=259542 RepID=A0AAV3Y0C0_9GAST|nr:histone-lysine N-methyltransferase SETMAR [Plakobranchus ocellatus]
MLSDEHKRQRVEISQILLHRCQPAETVDVGSVGDYSARNKLLEHLITGDEIWLHLSFSETKRDSMTWKHPSSPVTKKFKVKQSATKVMATVFLDTPQTNLAPSDFHLFGPLKRHLGGKKFEDEDEVRDWFSKLEANFFTQVEDLERNDGSAAKPYFMSKGLMKVLGKKNEKLSDPNKPKKSKVSPEEKKEKGPLPEPKGGSIKGKGAST